MTNIYREISERLERFEHPARVALSKRFPFLAKPILAVRRTARNIQTALDPRITYARESRYFPHVIARHQSLLRRKLGDSDPRLQEQKILNLRQAVQKLNGVVIAPGNTFSLWQILGKPSYKNGYVNGMLLSGGKVIEGVGGGLCQLSNFLFWIFLHAQIQVVERHHHSLDVFPDSGRTLPFGSGATIMYNILDLKVKNTSSERLQLKIWLTDQHLKGQLLSPKPAESKFHVFEENHFFVNRKERYFRFNEIVRSERRSGRIINTQRVVTNFAPVLYAIDPEQATRNGHTILDFASPSRPHKTRQRAFQTTAM